jgi:hypothetical protein
LLTVVRPALDLAAQVQLPQGDALDTARAEVRALLHQLGPTHTELAVLAQDLARLPSAPDLKTALRTFMVRVQQLKQTACNAPVLLQMADQFDAAQGSPAVAAQALTQLGLLATMLRAAPPPSEQTVARVLVPCSSDDFAFIFDECLAVFELCAAPMGHAALTHGVCLHQVDEHTLRTTPCSNHEFLQGVTLFHTEAVLHKAASTFALPALRLVRLEAKHRQVAGTYPAFVPVHARRPSDRLRSAPDAAGFVAVTRNIVPPTATIVLTTDREVYVLQTL